MLVPILNKEYEKDKLLDLINSCSLNKKEIADLTQNPPDGFGKISIQTMYDLELKKPSDKPDQLKLFQLKEILRVIGEHRNEDISLSRFVSEEISKVRVVLEWNYKKKSFEAPDLMKTSPKALFFPNWINQINTVRACLTVPVLDNKTSNWKDHRVCLFDDNKQDWNIHKKENLLWRPCIVKIKDHQDYVKGKIQKFYNDNVISFLRYLGYVHRKDTSKSKEKNWIPTWEVMDKLEIERVYPLEAEEIVIDDISIILDLV